MHPLNSLRWYQSKLLMHQRLSEAPPNGAADNPLCGSSGRMVTCLSFSLAQSLCRLYRSKAGFIRLFGGGADFALERRWTRMLDSTGPQLVKSIAPETNSGFRRAVRWRRSPPPYVGGGCHRTVCVAAHIETQHPACWPWRQPLPPTSCSLWVRCCTKNALFFYPRLFFIRACYGVFTTPGYGLRLALLSSPNDRKSTHPSPRAR